MRTLLCPVFLLLSAICKADGLLLPNQEPTFKERPPIVQMVEKEYFLVSPKDLFMIGVRRGYKITFDHPYMYGLQPYLIIGPTKAMTGIKLSY